MPNIKTISKIFSDFLADVPATLETKDPLSQLVRLNIEMNRKLWNLEDSARTAELGSEHVAKAKQEIDKNNQIRNDLISEMDAEITKQMGISSGPQEQFYSESPGMIIDRLSILFIKLSVIRGLLLVIKEKDLREEYKEKEEIILNQIDHIGNFLNSYFTKLAHKEVFFEIMQPVKIYNDDRIRKYIKIIKN
jgi:hypothetical protein